MFQKNTVFTRLRPVIHVLIILGMLGSVIPVPAMAMTPESSSPLSPPAAVTTAPFLPEAILKTAPTLASNAALTDTEGSRLFLPLISKNSGPPVPLVEPITPEGGVITYPARHPNEGSLTLDFAPGAVDETLLISILRDQGGDVIPATDTTSAYLELPLPDFPLQWFQFDARRPGEEDIIALNFHAPVTLTYNFAITEVAALDPASLSFVYMDPLSGTLQPISSTLPTRLETRTYPYPDPETGEIISATVTQEVPTGEISAVINHFSTYGITGDEAAWVSPALDAFEVSLARGQASYSYDIPVPAGPNGFAPKLSLQYNSGLANGLIGDKNTDGGWVGTGWTLDLGHINNNTVSINGVQEQFLPGSDGELRTRHETYMDIRHITKNPQVCYDDIWIVTDRAGTTYYFGNGLVQSYFVQERHNCAEYKLYRVVDIHNNTMDISYEKIKHSDRLFWLYSELYPKTISYTTHDTGALDTTAEYRIEFDLIEKGTPKHGLVGERTRWLRQIRMYFGEQLIRAMVFDIRRDGEKEVFKLEGLHIKDSSGTLDPIPPITFSYTDLDIGHRFTGRNRNPGHSNWVHVFKQWQRPFLTAVDNGSGGAIRFDYAPYLYASLDSDGHAFSRPLFQIVRARYVHDAVTGLDSFLSYNYNIQGNEVIESPNSGEGYRNVAHFGHFHGFAQVDVVDSWNYLTRHFFNNSAKSYKTSHILNGRETQTERYTGLSGQLLSRTVNSWQSRREPSWPDDFAFVFKDKQVDYVCDGVNNCVASETTWNYDHLTGNLLSTSESSSIGTPYRRTEYQYTSPNEYNITRPFRQTLREGTALVGEIRYYYDGLPYGQASIGDLTAKRVKAGNNQYVDTKYAYDLYGNRTHEYVYPEYGTESTLGVGEPRTIQTIYDDHKVYAYQVINPLGHRQTVEEFDYRFQVPIRERDANDAITQYAYDSLGRLAAVWLPDCAGEAAFKAEYHNYAGPAAPYREVARQRIDDCSGSAIYANTHVFYDGLGRKIQAHTPGDTAGSAIVTYVAFDELGRLKYTSVPVALAGSPGTFRAPDWQTLDKTETQYDALGRVTRVEQPDGSLTRSFYYLRDTAVIDANGHIKISSVDAFGRLITVKEFDNAQPFTSVSWNETPAVLTSYVYDVRDSLTEVRQEVGSRTIRSTMTYNDLGQKIAMDDPDMGNWIYSYDPLGNLVSQTDARGVTTHIVYDTLNRPTGKSYTIPGGLDIANPGPVFYTYDEDGAAANANGRRTGMTDPAGLVSWQYDARGRVIAETREFTGDYIALANADNPQGSFTTAYTYFANDLVRTTTYPDGEVVRSTYSRRGLPLTLDGSVAYVQSGSVVYDERAHLTALTLGNTLNVTYNYFEPDTQGGRLQRVNAGGDMLDLAYTYDPVGNIASVTDRSDAVGQQTTDFVYDALDRLVSAQTTDGAALIPGYHETYAYDVIGNITQRTDQRANETLDYTYAENGAGPHAVTSVNDNDYHYDENGNMTLRLENGAVFTQTWTAENKLARVDAGPGSSPQHTRFVYDGDGNRLLKIELFPSGGTGFVEFTTTYIGGIYEEQFETANLFALAAAQSNLSSGLTRSPGLSAPLTMQAATPILASRTLDDPAPARAPAATNTPEASPDPAQDKAREAYGQLPLSFEANQGQTADAVQFLSRGPGYTMFMTPDGLTLSLRQPTEDGESAGSAVVQATLVGANPNSQIEGLDALPGRTNYLIGNDPAKWRTDVMNYEKVHYRQVWPGIDLLFYGNQRQLEYDFVVAPGADPGQIALHYAGAERLELAPNGDLLLHVAGGELRQKAPVIYQNIAGRRVDVSGHFIIQGYHVTFELGDYDPGYALVIDPLLIYSTYLGGSGTDTARVIAIDEDGAAYVTGTTYSFDFPTTPDAYDRLIDEYAVGDVFVTKLNSDGTALIYSTFLGGDGVDHGDSIAVDADGSVYVTGRTSGPGFPTTVGSYTNTLGIDAFVSKLNASGTNLLYSILLRGSNDDRPNDLAVDGSGAAYVVGSTGSSDFPTTTTAFDTTYNGAGDGFVTKLDASGTGLVYSTFLGGSEGGTAQSIAVDSDGVAYVTGFTFSSDFPTTANAYTSTHHGQLDGFVTKLNADGSDLVYSTFFGGSEIEYSISIAIDDGGAAYVTGITQSPDFPITPGAYDTTCDNIFVTKFNPEGADLVYSTFLRGYAGSSIAVDSDGMAHIVGSTVSDFPTTPNAYDTTFNGGESDGFVTKLNADGTALIYSTFLGGYSNDDILSIAIDGNGAAYVTGNTGPNFPTTPGAYDTNTNNMFITRLDIAPPTNPTIITETHGALNEQWHNISEPDFIWSGANGTGSGIQGYYVYWGIESDRRPLTDTLITIDSFTPISLPVSGEIYYLRIMTEDNAGNISAPETFFIFKYDASPPGNAGPIVETHGVLSNTWQSAVDTPSFTWTPAIDVIGGGVVGYRVYWGDEASGTAPTTFVTTTAFAIAEPLSDGEYYLRVQAEDAAGNVSDNPNNGWQSFTFLLDSGGPTMPLTATELSAAAESDLWQNRTADPNFSWPQAEDPNGVLHYQVYWGSSPTQYTPVVTVTDPAFDPAGDVASGTTMYLQARAQDSRGSWSDWQLLFVFRYDDQAPLVNDLTPPDGSRVTEVQPTLSATWTDSDAGVAPLSTVLTLDGVSIPASSLSLEPEAFSYTPTETLSPGAHYAILRVFDAAGNETEVTWSFIVDPDTSVDIAFPASGTTLNQAHTPLVVTLESGAGMQLSVTAGDNTFASIVDDGRWVTDSLPLDPGVNVISATVVDPAGNSATDSITVSVDPGQHVALVHADPALFNPQITSPVFNVTALPGEGWRLEQWSLTVWGVNTPTVATFGDALPADNRVVLWDGHDLTGHPVSDGEYTYQLVMTVTNGLGSDVITAPAGQLTVVSQVPGEVTLDCPGAPAVVWFNTTPPALAQGSAPEGTYVQLYVDGVPLGNLIPVIGGHWQGLVPLVDHVSHTVAARAIDAAGNLSEPPATCQMGLSRTDPFILPHASLSDSVIGLETAVAMTASTRITGASVLSVQATVPDQETPISLSETSPGTWNGTWQPTPADVEQNVVVQFDAEDAALPPNHGHQFVQPYLDLVPPVTRITAPVDGHGQRDSILNLSGTTERLSTIYITLTPQGGGAPLSVTLHNGVHPRGEWQTSLSVPGGAYNMTAYAVDRAGNYGPVAGPYTISVDGTPPELSQLSVTPRFVQPGEHTTIAATAVDTTTHVHRVLAHIQDYPQAGLIRTVELLPTGDDRFSSGAMFILTDVLESHKTISIQAWDPAGNTVEDSLDVYVDGTAPTFSPLTLSLVDPVHLFIGRNTLYYGPYSSGGELAVSVTVSDAVAGTRDLIFPPVFDDDGLTVDLAGDNGPTLLTHSYPVDNASVLDDDYVLTAVDRAENSGTSEAFGVTWDGAAPEVGLTLSAGGDIARLYADNQTHTFYYNSDAGSSTMNVSLELSDGDAGVGLITFPTIFGDAETTDLAGANGPVVVTHTYPVIPAQPSDDAFTITVVDTVSNTATAALRVVQDTVPPVITLTVTPPSGLAIPVAWPSHDALSGIRQYQVQVQVNGGDWSDWFAQTTATQATYVSTPGESYRFRIKATDNVGNTNAEWSISDAVSASSPVRKYYTFNGQRLAMRQGEDVHYFTGDHLRSVSLTTDGGGTLTDERRYLPYGQERWSNGAAVTDFGFTGQRNEAGFGLMDYNARYYSPVLGRFISADTVVPEPGETQTFNRYTYVSNNPLRYSDPSGHIQCGEDTECTPSDFQQQWGPVGTSRPGEHLSVDEVLEIAGLGVKAAGHIWKDSSTVKTAGTAVKIAGIAKDVHETVTSDDLSIQKQAALGKHMFNLSFGIALGGDSALILAVANETAAQVGTPMPSDTAGRIWGIYTEAAVGDRGLVGDAILAEYQHGQTWHMQGFRAWKGMFDQLPGIARHLMSELPKPEAPLPEPPKAPVTDPNWVCEEPCL